MVDMIKRDKMILDLFNSQDEKNKTEVGRQMGVSARTVGRVLDKYKDDMEEDSKVIDSGWIDWNPEPFNRARCPVDGGVRVELEFRSGELIVTSSPNVYDWHNKELPCDVVAYRILGKYPSEHESVVEGKEPEPKQDSKPEPKFLVTSNTIMIAIDDKIHSVDSSHENFDVIAEAIRDKDFDLAIRLSDVVMAVNEYMEGEVTATNGSVEFRGKKINSSIVNRIIEQMNNNIEPRELVRFLGKVMENPSFRAANELFDFISACSLPVTEDGCFLAYKRVRGDYKDCHSGTIDNSVGAVVEMERNEVNDDKEQICSSGLHFCSRSYLDSFHGEKLMVLKIHPKDVVSIPVDYNNAKGRCCKYEVVAEIDHYTHIPDFIISNVQVANLK